MSQRGSGYRLIAILRKNKVKWSTTVPQITLNSVPCNPSRPRRSEESYDPDANLVPDAGTNTATRAPGPLDRVACHLDRLHPGLHVGEKGGTCRVRPLLRSLFRHGRGRLRPP